MGETLRAASGELRYIQEARGAAKVLSKSIWPLMPDNAACTGFLQRMLEVESHYSLVAFVPLSGISTCNSAGRIFSFKDDPLFLRAAHDRGTSFAVKAVGRIAPRGRLRHAAWVPDAASKARVSASAPEIGSSPGRRPRSSQSRARALLTRLLTVPTATPVIWATSS